MELIETYHDRERVITELHHMQVYDDGAVRLETRTWDGRCKNYSVEIAPADLIKLSDKINEALKNLTGITFDRCMFDRNGQPILAR